jgi:hypothetical protein
VITRGDASFLQSPPELLNRCVLRHLEGDVMEKRGARPEVILRKCPRMIEECEERPVTDLEKEMAILLVVATRIRVVEDDRQGQRHAENVLVEMPRRLRVPAAQADMIDMPQRVARTRLERATPVFFLDLDARETTPQGILISNDVLTLCHDALHDTTKLPWQPDTRMRPQSGARRRQ